MQVESLARAAGRRHPLRNVLLACMLVLLVSQAMIGAMSLSALNRLTIDNTAKRVEVLATSASSRIETGMVLGKPLAQFFGLTGILEHLRYDIPDLVGANVVLVNGQLVDAQGQHIRNSTLVQALRSGSDNNSGVQRNPSGTVYRSGGQSIVVAVPLKRADKTLAGALVLKVPQQGTRQHALMVHNAVVLILVTLAAALILGLFFGYVLPKYDMASVRKSHVWFPLIILLLAQGIYAGYTIHMFRDVWVQVTRENTEILGQGLQHDLDHVLGFGIAPTHLRGVDKPMSRLARAFPAISEVRLLAADGTVLNRAGAQGALPVQTAAKHDDVLNFSLRARSDGPLLASLQILPDKALIAAGVRARILDAATVIAAALVVAIELLMLLTLFMGRAFAAPVTSSTSKPTSLEDLSNLGAVVRPVIFGFMFAVALPLSFLPLYARSLLSANGVTSATQLLMALPIVAEMGCGLLTVLIAGHLVDRRGWQRPVIAGLVILVLGNLACAAAGTLLTFILARGLVGLGYGLAWMGLQGFIVAHSPAAYRGRHMASLIAGLFAGHLSGAAVGAILEQQLGFGGVFLVGAVMLVLPALGVLTLMWPYRQRPSRQISAASAQRPRHSWSALCHLLLTRDFGVLLVGSIIPFSIAQIGLLTYALPIYMDAHGASVTSVGRVLMIYGFCVIYIGPFMGRMADRSKYRKYWIAGGGLIGSAGLLGMHFASGIAGAALAVFLLALASCLAGGAQTAYVLALHHVQVYGAGQATSVMRAADKFGQMLGPLLLGGLFASVGIAGGLVTTGILYLLGTLAFMMLAPRLQLQV